MICFRCILSMVRKASMICKIKIYEAEGDERCERKGLVCLREKKRIGFGSYDCTGKIHGSDA